MSAVSLPKQVKLPKPINPRLVTKTSLTHPKPCIALLILLWYANNKPGSVSYGASEGAGSILDDALVDSIQACATTYHIDLHGANLQAVLSKNALVTAQLESLNAAFELVWPLATFSFADPTKNRSAERTGGVRLGKVIHFTTNMDILDAAATPDQDGLVRVSFNWLTNGAVECGTEMTVKIERILSSLAETSFYKSMKGEDGIIYTTSGIYDSILAGNDTVLLTNPDQETQGPTRILKAAIDEGLNPFLVKQRNGVSANSSCDPAELKNYSERARNGIAISNVVVEEKAVSENDDDAAKKGFRMADNINEPRNLIFFGAPGTGKSYQLDKLAEENFGEHCVRRVTFYPDYTYSQFVGCFKPYSVPNLDSESPASAVANASTTINYRFVPGPFIMTYVDAVKHPERNYLLIIEEINRANPAAVFGDVFQLLDRDAHGVSEYAVSVSEDLHDYLKIQIGPFLKDPLGHPFGAMTPLNDPNLCKATAEIRIPDNMYLWATMNSADQGVFPMDTAFKRRWDFRYMGINDGEETEVDGVSMSKKTITCGGRKVYWNELRKAINKLMIGQCKLNEDKLLGPFFLSPESLTEERFSNAFKNKVLLYLYEDAGRMKRRDIFWDYPVTYSQVCSEFDSHGTGVFGRGFDDSSIWADAEDEADDSDASAEG